MNKVTKIFIAVACVVAFVAGVLSLPATREFAARRALKWLAGRFDARAGFESVGIGWRGDVRFNKLYFVDNQGDTILRGDVGVGLKLGRKVAVRRVAVSDGRADILLMIKRLHGDGGAKIGAIELRRMMLVYDTLTADRVGLDVRDFVAHEGDISLKLKGLNLDYRGHGVAVSAPELAIEKRVLTADGAQVEVDGSRLDFAKLRYDFTAKKFETAIENSSVTLRGVTLSNLNINASGTPDDISGHVDFVSDEAILSASGRWQPREKGFDVRVDSLIADAGIVDILAQKPLADTLRTMLGRLGRVSVKGDLGGKNGEYIADATVSTELGLMDINGSLSGDYTPQGEVKIEHFDLGRLLAIKDMGRATASAMIKGRSVEAEVHRLDYKGYDYQHITARGGIENGQLSVQAVSHDPAFSATLDLREKNFGLNVLRADLRAMNIDERGNQSVLRLEARGNLGKTMRIEADNILYVNHIDSIYPRKTTLFCSAGRVEISSDMALLGALVPGLKTVGNSSFTLAKNDENTTFYLRAQRLERGAAALQNLRIDGSMHADTIALSGKFDIGAQHWGLAANEMIVLANSLLINGLTLNDGSGQRICVDGIASSARADTLNISVENFDMAPLSDIVRTGHAIAGEASGRIVLASALERPTITLAMALDSMKIDHVELPNLDFSTSWEDENLRLLLNEAGGKTIATASYSMPMKRMEGRIDIKNIDLSLLDTHYKRTMSASRGRADLVATFLDGKISGDILVHDYSALVDYLGVRYAAAPETHLKIEDNIIKVDSATIADPENNPALLTARIDLCNLKDVSYNLDISTPNSLVLNTSYSDNAQFYGRVFASATAGITGSKMLGTDLTVSAATLPGSQFFMPLNDKRDIDEADYLTFVDHTAAAAPKTQQTQRLAADIALQIEPNTPIELLIDPRTGHRIRTRGNGLINLHVAPREDEFTLYGDYRIDEGIYLFTVENIIEKPFVVTPGSMIRWTGNPHDALLDISATYDLKTSITPAMQGTGFDTWRTRVPVECRLLLADRLSTPTLTFDITAPQATPETQTMLRNFLSTEEMTATQFFFLLATGNFYDSETAANIGSAAGTTTALDFLSGQISNLIPSENFDIGIRYRRHTETTSDEWGVDFSQQLWGERLLLEIEGNYDTRNNSGAVYTENQNNFTGDFNLTGILDRRGTLRAKAFTRTITRFDENQGLQESGAGIYFTEEFNTFGEIFRRKGRKRTGGGRHE